MEGESVPEIKNLSPPSQELINNKPTEGHLEVEGLQSRNDVSKSVYPAVFWMGSDHPGFQDSLKKLMEFEPSQLNLKGKNQQQWEIISDE